MKSVTIKIGGNVESAAKVLRRLDGVMAVDAGLQGLTAHCGSKLDNSVIESALFQSGATAQIVSERHLSVDK